jgi:acetyl esterase/lipase
MTGGIRPDRRMLLAAGLAIGAAGPIAATPAPGPFETFPVWPGQPPGGDHVTVRQQEVLKSPAPDDVAVLHVTRPTLTRLLPARANGAALLLIPGGGYRRVAMKGEGLLVARHFAARGFTCYILLYRLPADGWAAGPDAPLQDAQRAMRLIGAQAPGLGVDPARIAAIGFSAGGHLAARLSSELQPAYASADTADERSFRPALTGLLYPVITMAPPLAHAGSAEALLGPHPTDAARRRLSAERLVHPATPPAFLAHAADDPAVPTGNSLLMFDALRRAGVPREMHIFETGGHGFGLTLPDGSPSPWPELFARWAGRHGLTG